MQMRNYFQKFKKEWNILWVVFLILVFLIQIQFLYVFFPKFYLFFIINLFEKKEFVPDDNHKKVFIPLPLGVNYCALSLPGVQYTHEDYAKLRVLSVLLSYNYLHPTIREKGGAYGGGLRTGECTSFYSYRDPNVERTIDAFCNTLNWVKDGRNINDSDIEEAKLSLFGGLDAPVIPAKKGLGYFTTGISNEMRQQLRDQVFATTKDDLVAVAEKYFTNIREEGSITVIGNPEQMPQDFVTHALSKE